MGNCCRIKTVPYKYSENNNHTGQDSISLSSDSIITSISSASSTWSMVQDDIISVYQQFSLYKKFESQERVRSLHMTSDKIIYAGKKINILSVEGENCGKLEGHERTVTAIDCQSTYLASGSADWTMRLWDLVKLQELCKIGINWNVVTSIKYCENAIVQTSEDLRLRVWDVRKDVISVQIAVGVGDNFANCCDFEGNFVVTGHRGFDGNGCQVKLWDLRNIAYPVFEMDEHEEAVQGVKFVFGNIVSCGKDGKIIVSGTDGKKKFCWEHQEKKPFCVMDKFNEGILVGNIEPKISYFSVNPLIKEF